MKNKKRIVASAVCVFLLTLLAHADGRGSHRFSVGVTTQGFCSLKISWEYAVAADAYVGAFWQTSALMVAQGKVDSGEIGGLFRMDRDLGRDAAFEAAIEAGYRYQNQNLGFVQSFFSRQDFRPLRKLSASDRGARVGADLGWDQTWVTHIRYSDYVRATWLERYPDGSSPPVAATQFLPSTKFRLGGCGSAFLVDNVGLSFAGGWLVTPRSLVGGFDGMMFGLFPFYSDLSFRLSD